MVLRRQKSGPETLKIIVENYCKRFHLQLNILTLIFSFKIRYFISSW